MSAKPPLALSRGLLPGLLAGMLLLLALSLQTGPIALQWSAVWADAQSVHGLIFWELRLPRAVLTAVVGATLGLAGAAMQGLLRNPLAEPGFLGVSGCAALAVVVVFYFGLAGTLAAALPLAGIVGALASVVLLFFLAGREHSVLALVLAGVAVNAWAGAMVALALNFAPSPFAVTEIVYWLMGSTANRSWAELALALPLMLIGWVFILASGRFLDALSLGEDTAQTLGFDLARWRWQLIIGVACCVGAAVAVSGTIGFVGLVVPHLLRPLLGYQPRRLLPYSALGGAVLLLCADLAVQTLSPARELKIGVVTALIGGPFFLYLIYQTRHKVL